MLTLRWQNVEKDFADTLRHYKRKYLEHESGRHSKGLAAAIIKKSVHTDRHPRIPLPPSPIKSTYSDDTAAPLARAVLSQLSDKALLHTGKLDLRGRGMTSAIAKVVSDRILEVGLNVKEIDVSMNKLKMEGFFYLCTGLLQMPALKSICASDCGLEFKKPQGGLAAQARVKREEIELVQRILQSATELESLDLSKNKLEAMGVGVLVRASPNSEGAMSKHLVHLDLSSTGIRDTYACSSLARLLKNLQSLKTLKLAYNAIRGKEAAMVAQGLVDCTSLESVDLSHNGFGDEPAAKELSRLLAPDSKIKHLDLSFNRFELKVSAARCPLLEQHFAVLEKLPELLPMIARHEGKNESEQVMRIREIVNAVQIAVQKETDSGRIQGSIMPLVSKAKRGQAHSLRSINFDGNLLSRLAEGVVVHLLTFEPFEAEYRVEKLEERTWSRHVSKEKKIKENITVVTCPPGHTLPRTALRAGGLQVWEVSEDGRYTHLCKRVWEL